MTARLHYLYDQHGGGRERFVYFCSSCNCVLQVRRDLRPAGDAFGSARGGCLGCGRPLDGGVECRLTAAPDEWADLFVGPEAQRAAPEFRQASSLPHFSLGFPALDSLLRPFRPGTAAAVAGPGASIVAELAAFRAQLPVESGGLDSPVVFIDGGNRSDPYLFSSFARQYGRRPDEAMRRIASCRAFTMYQMADLVCRHLAPAARDYGAQLLVVSDLLGTFNEPELDEREARRLLSAMERAVEAAKKDALVLVTLESPSKYDGMVLPWADAAVALSHDGARVRADLVRHPARALRSSSFRMGQLLSPRRAAR